MIWNGQRTQKILLKRRTVEWNYFRRITHFGASWEELKNIYILYITSLLEQSCTVWNSGLTEENIHDLERIQKSACRLILQDSYKSYDNALNLLDFENLQDRRESLWLQFARKCFKYDKMKHLFPKNFKTHKNLKWFMG